MPNHCHNSLVYKLDVARLSNKSFCWQSLYYPTISSTFIFVWAYKPTHNRTYPFSHLLFSEYFRLIYTPLLTLDFFITAHLVLPSSVSSLNNSFSNFFGKTVALTDDERRSQNGYSPTKFPFRVFLFNKITSEFFTTYFSTGWSKKTSMKTRNGSCMDR